MTYDFTHRLVELMLSVESSLSLIQIEVTIILDRKLERNKVFAVKCRSDTSRRRWNRVKNWYAKIILQRTLKMVRRKGDAAE